ncbi:MAG: DUF3087 family protein [bacterium]
MNLRPIDKPTYRARLNRLIIAFVAAAFPLALLLSTVFIRLFSTPEASHLAFNIGGAIMAVLLLSAVLNAYRRHPWMDEIVYVWELKQELNRIYRKSRKINKAIEAGDCKAMNIMCFSYNGSKQVYELDNNTLTMTQLEKNLKELEDNAEQHGCTLSLEQYDSDWLKQY